MSTEKQTLIEDGTTFRGTLDSTCKVVVRGAIEGEVSAPALEVAVEGTVTGSVHAKSLRCSGTLAGSVDADDVVLSGRVKSDTNIRAKTLEVALTREGEPLGVTFGECMIEIGDPDAATAVRDEPDTAVRPSGDVQTPVVQVASDDEDESIPQSH